MTANSSGILSDWLDYALKINPPEHPTLTDIRRYTELLPRGAMHIAPEQAQWLAWLVKLTDVKRYLEVGVFTGYSSTAVALALPENGTIDACDISVTFTNAAKNFWQAAGVAHKIRLHLQPALITLDEMIGKGMADSFDMALIDADKEPTPHYFERCLTLVRAGGIIAIDNVFLGGRVFSGSHDSPSIRTLQAFNQSLHCRHDIIPLTLPIGDGLTLVIKKSPSKE